MRDGFRHEAHCDNEISVIADDDGGVSVSVSDEKAMDSYNQTFECSIRLGQDEARALRDYLVATIK